MKIETTIYDYPGQTPSDPRGEMRYAYLGMFFNGVPVEITIAGTPDYFKGMKEWGTPGGQTFKIWGKAVMLTADGQGEAQTLRVNGDELLLETEFGNFRVRMARPDDKLIYGCNNYKGVFLEKMPGGPKLSEQVNEKFEEIKRLIASAAKWHEEHGCLESMYDSTEQAQEEIIGGLQTIEPEEVDPNEDLCETCGAHVGYGHPDFHLKDRGEHGDEEENTKVCAECRVPFAIGHQADCSVRYN